MNKIGILIITLSTLFFTFSCSEDESCNDIVCLNNGTCSAGICECPDGYVGLNCQINRDDCANNPCLNDGLCLDGLNEYTCECKDGFGGDICEINLNGCPEENPCLNGGTCLDRANSYICDCSKTDFVGNRCQLDDKTSFITTWNTENKGRSNDNQVIIKTRSDDYTYNYNIDCDSDGVFEAENQTGDYTCNYDKPGVYSVMISGVFPAIYFEYDFDDINFRYHYLDDNYKLVSINQWGTQKWTTMEKAFAHCINMTLNASDKPDLSNVTSMNRMFFDAEIFNTSINNWDVSNVEDMSGLFLGCDSYNQPLNLWDVSNVTDMGIMFTGADIFNQDLSSWKVDKVTYMFAMFSNTKSFNSNISSWNVSSVTNMSKMFFNADSFNQDLSSWNVDNVTSCKEFDYETESWILPRPIFACNIDEE